MNFKSAFEARNILIPRLQRDYVQGGDEAVINPFLDYLLSGDCDLNYIYGYSEAGAFVPVDGQQRLTTLWLLYLYIHSKSGDTKPFATSLSFHTREFASDFCETLVKRLPQLMQKLKDLERKGCPDKRNLDEIISGECWFIPSWRKNLTVANMLSTLRYIHAKLAKKDCENEISSLRDSGIGIRFEFLNMTEENKLDDDIYIKMNGRGRPLSQFENLKSWIDEKIARLSFSAEWRKFMDNRWTTFFWNNRNTASEHPEEIDDEQLHCFANLMVLFHIMHPHILAGSVEGEFREELADFLNLPENVSAGEIAAKLLARLASGSVPPLVWFDRLPLMPEKFFAFAFVSLNRLSRLAKEFNSLDLYFRNDSVLTPAYSLAMTAGTFARTLPLLYALISFPGGETTLFDWMRIMRNLTLNTEIEQKDLGRILHTIVRMAGYCRKSSLFAMLNRPDMKSGKIADGFSSRQVDEEIRKASPEYVRMRPLFADLENNQFFSGRIGGMFNLLPGEEFTYERFGIYSAVLKTLFNGGDKGVSPDFDDSGHLLRRILMTYPPYYFGVRTNKNRDDLWSFCNGLTDWQAYVRDQDEAWGVDIGSLKLFLEDFAPQELDGDALLEGMRKRLESFACDYPAVLEKDIPDSFRFHFIHHPGVWSYIKNTNYVFWRGKGFDIDLRRSFSNNANHMDLRTYVLYLDYRHNEDLAAATRGWDMGLYEKGITCFYLERKETENDEKGTIAIDVFFGAYNSGRVKRNSENCYGFSLFRRTDSDEIEDQIRATESIITSSNRELIAGLGLQLGTDGRYSIFNLSRKEAVSRLNRLLSCLF